MQSSDAFVLDKKPVFDWNKVPVGHVTTTLRDPKTRATTALTLHLSQEAKTELGTTLSEVDLPASYIFGMRRDALTLDRSLHELKSLDLFGAVLKK